MIIEALLSFVFGLVGLVIGLFPSGNPPAWLADGGGYLAQLVGYAAGLGAWIPFGLAGTVVTALLVCVGLGFVIFVVRMVVSFFTGGGGSA